MTPPFERPITYLITPGDIVAGNYTEKSRELIRQVRSAVDEEISLFQIREKRLDTKQLFALVEEAAAITRGTSTQLVVNDRADVAVAAGADGVHLTTHSLPAFEVRKAFGPDLLIAVSTHTLNEAETAARSGADLIVFGPVFETPGKGEPVGLEKLAEVSRSVRIPVVGLGGIDINNFRSVLNAGAAGFAGIRCFKDPPGLTAAVGKGASKP